MHKNTYLHIMYQFFLQKEKKVFQTQDEKFSIVPSKQKHM